MIDRRTFLLAAAAMGAGAARVLAVPSAPTAAVHDGQPYLDPSGDARPYRPPTGIRTAAGIDPDALAGLLLYG